MRETGRARGSCQVRINLECLHSHKRMKSNPHPTNATELYLVLPRCKPIDLRRFRYTGLNNKSLVLDLLLCGPDCLYLTLIFSDSQSFSWRAMATIVMATKAPSKKLPDQGLMDAVLRGQDGLENKVGNLTRVLQQMQNLEQPAPPIDLAPTIQTVLQEAMGV